MPEILKIESISKRFGNCPALDGVSFNIMDGEIVGLLGPNGAGKSTLMKIVVGGLKQSSGKVLLDGKEKTKKGIAFVPQDFAFFEEFTVLENFEFFGAQLNALSMVSPIISFMGLEGFSHKRAENLSGGYKRLLNIGIALLQKPQLLFLDEPTVGLDPINRAHLWEKIRWIQKRGIAICISTHYMEEAQALCDRVCLLSDGKVAAMDTPENLIKQFASTRITTIHLSRIGDQKLANSLSKEFSPVELSTQGNTLVFSLSTKKTEKLEIAKAILKLQGYEIVKSRSKEPDLEQVFIRLTGKELRET